MTERKARNSSFELMRIMSMLMVCAFHWQLHGYGDKIPQSELCINQVISFCLGSWGILGVNLFFLLSFYFLIKKENANYKRVLALILRVSFYGTVVYGVCCLLKITNFSVVQIGMSFLGVFAYQYWFITVYVIIAVISPMINKLLASLEKKESIILLCILLYSTYIISWAMGTELVGRLSCGLSLYVLLYVLEKKVEVNYFDKFRKFSIVVFIGGIIFEIALSYIATDKNPIFYKFIEKVQTTASPYILVLSVLVFYSFKNWNFKENRIINTIGKYSAGAYLLHGGAGFIKDYLWDGLFKAGEYYTKPPLQYTTHYVLCILLLFFAGIFSEFIYSNSVDRLLEVFMRKKTRVEKS